MIPLDNKQLRWYRKDGKFELVSVDEAISRRLNKWKGWKCSAGVRALYIDYDGGVWVGNCASAARDIYDIDKWEPYRIEHTIEKYGEPPYDDYIQSKIEEKFGEYPYTDYIQSKIEEKFGEYPYTEYINKKIEEKFSEYPHTDYIEQLTTEKVEKKFGKFPHEEYVKQKIDEKIGESYPHSNFHYKYGDHSGFLFEKLLNRVNREFSEKITKFHTEGRKESIKSFELELREYNKKVKQDFEVEIKKYAEHLASDFDVKIKKYAEHLASDFDVEIKQYQKTLFPNFLKSGIAYKGGESKKSENWGDLGDIYSGFEYPKKWVICPFNSCGCGSDVIISKFKDDNSLLSVTNDGYEGQDNTHDNFIDQVQDGVGIEMNFPISYQVLWDISRRCNYDCSYCWPNVHNNKDEHFEKEVAFKTTDKIIEWANGNEVRFNFGGGEPTLVPYFTEWMKYLKEKNQWTMVTTNGSMSNSFWEECVKYLNSINMSAHFNSMASFPNRKERFLRNIEIILDYHDRVEDDHWLEIKLMTPPGKLNEALDFKEQIESLNKLHKPGANDRMKGVCSLVPIRSIENSANIVEYNNKELRYLQNQ
jgi:organic radical activating enzyme